MLASTSLMSRRHLQQARAAMLKNIKDSTLIHEEKRTLKWFLVLFFTISILYDAFFNFIKPLFVTEDSIGFTTSMGYLIYLLLILSIPFLFFLYNNQQLERIKYFFVILYVVLAYLNELTIYSGNNIEYTSGNAVEVFLILFSPIFLSERFFFVVTGSLLLKYVAVGITIQDPIVLFPIVLFLVISLMAYVLLMRILGYVNAVKSSYDKQLEGIVKGIIATLELKDPYTKGHSERVAYYSLSLAKKLNVYSKEELNAFYYACLLHDIGKIHIPDRILMKPGKLTEEEFEIIKTHPSVGAEAIKKVDKLNDSLSIILSHHERWDGRGYPEGLAAEKIPQAARIVSIADAFDAMTSTRSYRKALDLEIAYNRILEGRGTQFDPDLINIFKEVYPEWLGYHRESHNEIQYENSLQELKFDRGSGV
jgi:putative nucleotidyltransferase with HDIG domain